MFIVNQAGILNGWPDEWAIPSGHRKATAHEAGVFMTTGEQDTKKMPVALGDVNPPGKPAEPPAKPTKKGRK